MLKVALIYNPSSGKGINQSLLEKMDPIFQKYHYDPTYIQTEYAKHAEEIMESLTGFDLIISMGGDGTFSEVTCGNLKRRKPFVLAHIPVGTTNDIGAMYGYGKDPIKNLESLLEGVQIEVDVCTINKVPFVYSAAFGKFVNVAYDTPRYLKKKYGYFAYLKEGLKEFGKKTKSYDFEIQVDGEIIRGSYSFILISNANRIAGIPNFYENVKLNDKKFEVLLCSVTRKKDIIKGLLALKNKRITKVSGFDFYKTSSLQLKPLKKQDLEFSLDGEKYETKGPILFETKKTITLQVPKKNVKELME